MCIIDFVALEHSRGLADSPHRGRVGATHDLLRDEVRARPKAALRILHMLKAQGWQIQISEDDLTRIAATRAQTVIVSSGPDLPEATVTLYRRIQLAAR